MLLSVLLFTPLLAHAQLTDGCENGAASSSLTTSTVTSFITLGGTVTSFYDCLDQLPFCNVVNFQTSTGSPTGSETLGPTVVPAVGQPVTLSVTGSDGIPLAAELSSDGQLLLVDASTSTNATVLFADEDGFLRVYSAPSQVLFLGSWSSARGRFRRRQSTEGSGTTGQTELYTADEGLDPGSEFDGVSVIPVVQNDLPPISFSSSSTSTSSTGTGSQGSASSTEASITSDQQSITTPSSNTASTDATSETGTQDNTATSDVENSSSTSAEGSTKASSSSTGFTGVFPTDSVNPTVFATITRDGYEAVTDIISAGGAFYTCWCSSFLNLFAASRTVLFTSSVLDFSTSTSQTIVIEESTSTTLSRTGVLQATTTSYLPWPLRTRRGLPRAETISTPDALTRFPASNITVGCNLMVSYPVQATVEETTTATASGLTVVHDATTTIQLTETTEFYMSTEVSVVVATPSSFAARLGWRRSSGSLSYLEGGAISNSAFELEAVSAPAGLLTLDTTGRLVYPITDTNTGTTVDWYAAAPVVSDPNEATAVPLMFAEAATVASNGWQYIGFFPGGNTIFIDSSQSAGGYNNFGLCTYAGATTVETLVIMIDDTKPNDSLSCDFRSYLNFQ
ncbi:hypothetical protein TWF506_007273 [Arthrobotrys conoides]|uniref:Uncharacterized protein n=1 Tax=Arthrobotrys conoides TaxID=74498 RepID=A0AAN8N6Z7_9PEZI